MYSNIKIQTKINCKLHVSRAVSFIGDVESMRRTL